jgi:hypothetical protein
MKVKISIDQQTKSGFLSGTSHSYKLNVQFQLNEKEKKIFNDHPLFQNMIFMQYAAGKKKDIPMSITAKDIYTSRPISIEATSVNEVIDFRNEIDARAESFVTYLDILTDILGGREISYGE